MQRARHCHRHRRDAQRGRPLDSGRPTVFLRLARVGLGRWKNVVLRHQVLQVDHREVSGESCADAQNAEELQNRRTRRNFGGHRLFRHLRQKSCHLRPENGCYSPSRINQIFFGGYSTSTRHAGAPRLQLEGPGRSKRQDSGVQGPIEDSEEPSGRYSLATPASFAAQPLRQPSSSTTAVLEVS